MKTQILATVLFISTGMAFAQNSHRGEHGRGNNNKMGSNNNQESRSNARNQNFNYQHNEQHQRFATNTKPDRSNAGKAYGFNNGLHRGNSEPVRFEGRSGSESHDRQVWKGRGEIHERYNGEVNRRYSREIPERRNFHGFDYSERRIRNDYRRPFGSRLIWSASLCNDFRSYYPEIRYWRYPVGYSISLVPAYEASGYYGEAATVYGEVMDTYYNADNDQYLLYMNRRQFNVIIQGDEARVFSDQPERFFLEQNIAVTGYVNHQDGIPEIIVHKAKQIKIY